MFSYLTCAAGYLSAQAHLGGRSLASGSLASRRSPASRRSLAGWHGPIAGDRGVTAVEYGLILALIAGVIIAGLLVLGPAVGSLFSNSASCVNAPAGCNGP
jgi:pilus assembly protein Flp/PilA